MTKRTAARGQERTGLRGRLAAGTVAVGMATAGAAGCSGTDGFGDDGTLRIVGSTDVEHLDTASSISVGSYALTRVFARTLFGYTSSNTFAETVPIEADLAAEVPTRENGGISRNGRTYRIRLRPGVKWSNGRPVVADDLVRGLKRLCNPASPAGGMAYYTSTIHGFASYCEGFGAVSSRSATALAKYQNTHSITGLRTSLDTLWITLVRPASDFLNILSMGFAAPAPAEYDAYVPDSPELRRHTLSTGPYMIKTYEPGRRYLLVRNPHWSDDPLRGQGPVRIEITLAQDSPETVLEQLQQGTADLSWDLPLPASALPSLRDDPSFAVRETPSNSPYLVFNTLSPNNGGALGRREVRQALQFAVDRASLAKLYGGPAIARPLHTVIPPGNLGHRDFDLYPTPGDSGDPATCRSRLKTPLTLRFPYRTTGSQKRIAELIAQNLRACGVTVRLIPDTTGGLYGQTLVTPSQTRDGAWDIAAPGWTPDWYGNNGRSIIQPLFDGRTYGQNSTNYGGYDNPKVNALIDRALTASTLTRAADAWHEADRLIMNDAAIIPLLDRKLALYHSARVRNALFIPTAGAYDWTRIRL
ncbi:ABC transporter substrate-binding protein [Actinocorallia longicatena]|uniref:ABC transporter substrate-binding protein n=1 Tax=Actinocorallia longicatena TaxID=111803 RepID=A0ABP6QCY4_9ACTN